jgi:hypothetical protein
LFGEGQCDEKLCSVAGVPICGTQMLAWVLLLGTFIIDSIHFLWGLFLFHMHWMWVLLGVDYKFCSFLGAVLVHMVLHVGVVGTFMIDSIHL